MNNLHNQNHTTTFIDVESGQFISLPKDGTDKPPVNEFFNNQLTTFHSTGGEGTPSTPIPIVNVAEWNETSCARNLFGNKINTSSPMTVYGTGYKIDDTYSYYCTNSVKYYLQSNTDYTLSFKQNIVSSLNDYSYRCTILLYDNDDHILYELQTTSTTVEDGNTFVIKSFTTPTDCKYIQIRYARNLYGSDTVEAYYTDIMLLNGSYTTETMPTYTAFTGNTYPYRLEDTDGNLHYGGDLPDGTADTFNGKEFVENVKKDVVLDGTENWSLSNDDTTTMHFYYLVSDRKTQTAVRCNKFEYFNSLGGATIPTDTENITSGSTIAITILKSRLATEDVAGFKTWLGSNNIKVNYALATPVTYTIKQYNASTFAYNQKPATYQYYTNIFTDKDITLQGEVRKLGNRAMAYYDLQTVSGDDLYTITGNNNINCLYVESDTVTFSDIDLTEFTGSTSSYIFGSSAVIYGIELDAGTYTLSRNYQVLSGTPMEVTGDVRLYKTVGSVYLGTLGKTQTSKTFTLTEHTSIYLLFRYAAFGDSGSGLNVRFYNIRLDAGDEVLSQVDSKIQVKI